LVVCDCLSCIGILRVLFRDMGNTVVGIHVHFERWIVAFFVKKVSSVPYVSKCRDC
jgi:hypothetical protein